MENLGLAVFCGIWYFASTAKIGYHLTAALGTPVFISFLLGLLMGDMETALILGANINMLYLGIIATGGNVPADASLAALIAIPIALQTGMDVQSAVALAVPFGVLGALLDQVRRTVNAGFIHMADRYALEGNAKKVVWCNCVPPAAFGFILRFVPVFLATLFGADLVDKFLAIVPTWVTHGLSVAGGILPAMGFAITIMVIGKKKLMPFFFIGFFLVAYLGIDTMFAAILGACISVLAITMKSDKEATAA